MGNCTDEKQQTQICSYLKAYRGKVFIDLPELCMLDDMIDNKLVIVSWTHHQDRTLRIFLFDFHPSHCNSYVLTKVIKDYLFFLSRFVSSVLGRFRLITGRFLKVHFKIIEMIWGFPRYLRVSKIRMWTKKIRQTYLEMNMAWCVKSLQKKRIIKKWYQLRENQ